MKRYRVTFVDKKGRRITDTVTAKEHSRVAEDRRFRRNLGRSGVTHRLSNGEEIDFGVIFQVIVLDAASDVLDAGVEEAHGEAPDRPMCRATDDTVSQGETVDGGTTSESSGVEQTVSAAVDSDSRSAGGGGYDGGSSWGGGSFDGGW